jgi:hypothetical protein
MVSLLLSCLGIVLCYSSAAMKALIISLFLSLFLGGCSSSTGTQSKTNVQQAGNPVSTPTPEAKKEIPYSDPCSYSRCSQGDRLYWFVKAQKNALTGDEDWWEGNRSAEYENKSGNPALKVLCRNHKLIQTQIDSAGLFPSAIDSITTIPAKVDGKPTAFRWSVAKDDQTFILTRTQLLELLKHKNLVLGIEDYHGATYNLILQIPPLSPEMRSSCSL